MNTKSYTHYIFDLDQTILTLHIDWDAWLTVIEKTLREYGVTYTYTSDRQTFAALNDLMMREGEQVRLEINQRIRDAEVEHLHGYTPISHCISFLKFLPADTHRFIWTSNALDTAQKALRDNNLIYYFEKIAARDNVPYSKPDPSGFEYLYDVTVPKSQYVMIGDSENDEEAAQNAGIDFLNVSRLT